MNKISYILILFLIHTSLSWKNEGHMIIAQLIKNDLLKNRPEVYEFFDRLTKQLEDQQHGKVKSFIEASTWPDFMALLYGFEYLKEYHYNLIPFSIKETEGIESKKGAEIIEQNKDINSSETINPLNSVNFLKSAFNNIFNWSNEEIIEDKKQFEKSFNTIYITHIIADLHQPIHLCSLNGDKNSQYGKFSGQNYSVKASVPIFDFGGKKRKHLSKSYINYNDFKTVKKDISLNDLWNYMFFKVKPLMELPLQISDIKAIENISFLIENEFSKKTLQDLLKHDEFDLNNKENYKDNNYNKYDKNDNKIKDPFDHKVFDNNKLEKEFMIVEEGDIYTLINNVNQFFHKRVKIWAEQGFEICKEIYLTTTENSYIDDNYINKNFQVIKKQIALSAYRTSNILTIAYDLYTKKIQNLPKEENSSPILYYGKFALAGYICKLLMFR